MFFSDQLVSGTMATDKATSHKQKVVDHGFVV